MGFMYLEKFCMLLCTDVLRHGDSLIYSVCNLLTVPRVYYDTSVQALGGTSELRDDHDTLSRLLCSDEFVRDLL